MRLFFHALATEDVEFGRLTQTHQIIYKGSRAFYTCGALHARV
jgi:hypothetical protein